MTAAIRPGVWIAAYVVQTFSPLFWRPKRALFFGSRPVAKPAGIRVPTRHGPVRVLIYRPPGETHGPLPVHVQIHGGGFTGRYPEQDEHIAAYIASDVGAVVVSVDYDVAPQVTFPVAEEECYDVAAWIYHNAAANGWDAARISVGGESAGGKLAINVCQLAHRSDLFRPCALIAAFAVADVTRSNKTSGKRNPKISPAVQRLVNASYFADASRRTDPIASPFFDPELGLALPSTLILTGADDTLAPEMDELAVRLSAAGVAVAHRRFEGTDHGFTHSNPVATAREAVDLMGDFLRKAYVIVP